MNKQVSKKPLDYQPPTSFPIEDSRPSFVIKNTLRDPSGANLWVGNTDHFTHELFLINSELTDEHCKTDNGSFFTNYSTWVNHSYCLCPINRDK